MKAISELFTVSQFLIQWDATGMLVRIRFASGSPVERKGRKNRRVALALSALLTPAAVMASALAVWRIAADMKVTGAFAISNGFFSHWQVWMASAAVLQTCSRVLSHYGRSDDATTA